MARPRSTPALDVFSERHLVGRLFLDENGRFIFHYDASWLAYPDRIPLSHSLPLQTQIFPPDRARPFFANLLPEFHVRRLITETLHISERNDYALLEAIGGECAGAFSILPAGHKPPEKKEARRITDAELARWLDHLPERPILHALEGMRLSLAGAQNKLPVIVEGETILLPEGQSASTHILKPAMDRFEDSVLNETFCMRLAAVVGLPVPSVEIRQKPKPYFLIQRYDRVRGGSGLIKRLHQEDFCQALGILPENKYQSEGGPSLADCFRVLAQENSHLLEDRRHLLRWIIFNVLIGNADAHAKNISLLWTPQGARLAPFYDLLSTEVYPALAKKLAMKIGGENRPEWIQKRHWERLAAEIEVKQNLVYEYVRELSAALPKTARILLQEFPDRPLLHKIQHLIETNGRRITTRLV